MAAHNLIQVFNSVSEDHHIANQTYPSRFLDSLPNTSTYATALNSKLRSSNNILVIGDSWATQTKDYIDYFCSGATSYNFGIQGEMAASWVDVVPANVQDAFSDNDVTYNSVFFSIGGNDFFWSECTLNQEEVQEVVSDALSTVVQKIGNAVPIVMIGYCASTACQTVCEPVEMNARYESLNFGIKAACEATPNCSFVDVWRVCDFDYETGYSSGVLHRDPIHISKAGYCKIFEQPEIQAAFNCEGGATTECGEGESMNRCQRDVEIDNDGKNVIEDEH